MESAYQLLIKKIDQFIRKFYVNRMLRGILYWTGLVLSAFLVVTLTEFRAYFAPGWKIAIVSVFGLVTAVSFAVWILRPALSYLALGRRISHEQAASIIGDHFPNVKDKLLNILQLKGASALSSSNRELIEASINQKSEAIKLVPFTGAINLGQNRRYLKYALPPAMILLAISLGSPNVLRDGTRRLAKPTTHFEREAPFKFEIASPQSVVQYEDAEVRVRVDGKVLPAEVYIHKEGKPFKMTARQRSEFSYTFRNVPEGFEFYAEAQGHASRPQKIDVIPKPTLLDAQVDIRYPAYTGRKPEVLRNIGELTLPVGSQATWKFNTRHTSAVSLHTDSGEADVQLENQKGFYQYSDRLMRNREMTFYLSSDALASADSVLYNVDIIADRYPSIQAEMISDTVNKSFMYFIGEYSDDYGISNLSFQFRLQRADDADEDSLGSEKLQFEKNASIGRFSHYTNAALYDLRPGDQLEFYFEVSDNDGVNGAKSSRSRVFTFKKPTVEEFKEQESANNQAIKDNLEDAIEKVESFAKEVNELKEDVLEKKNLSWEEKKKLEDLLQEHNELTRALEQMQQTFEENKQNQDEFKKTDEEILKKQERIEELMDELLTEEMKEMMDQIREMMEELDMNRMFENLEDFEMSNEELEMQLDRMLELFKKLEFEQKVQDAINELEELAEQQKELGKESEKEGADSEEILEKQEKLNEQFEQLKEDLGELDQMNKEQNSPMNLDKNEEQSEQISEEMQKGTEQLEQQQPQKASPSQQKAGEQMQQMAQQMQQQMSSMEMMQAMEDLDNLRQLLENLVKLSFDQELLFEDVKVTQTEQPLFRELVQQQYKLKDDAAMIEDSLVALSKRVFQLESFITEELHKMNREIGQSIDNMEERRKGQAVTNQQYVMTSANNLALMLSEVMEQMQQAMAQSMPGSQQCQKPGGMGMPTMQQMQQQLNQDMQNMKDAIKKGKQPGGAQMSKEFARMAAQQAALREALRKMKEQMSQGQKDGGNVDDLMQKMDETETDLLNKRITEETLKRQEEIITNLLDMETAEREQDKEEKRESKTADQVNRKLPPEIEEYLRERQSTVEVFQTVPPALTPFYKKLVEKYFKAVN